MALAFDASANLPNGAGATQNFSHTCSGVNRILFVTINTGIGSDIITGVTYNSVAMTLVDKQLNSSNDSYTYLYYLINPSTGANNITITNSNAAIGIRAASASYTGAKLSAQPDNTAKNTATGTSISQSLTPVADNCWIVSGTGNEGSNPSAGTGTTLRDTGSTSAIGDTNGPIHPAASTSMAWSTGGSVHLAVIMASISPALDVVVGSARSLLGVGL